MLHHFSVGDEENKAAPTLVSALPFTDIVHLDAGQSFAAAVWDFLYTVYIRVYQNLAILSENYRTFPKVGPYYKEKACKFLARSDYSLRPSSCVLFEIFVARREINTAQ